MNARSFRYEFRDRLMVVAALETLEVAVIATESLFGEVRALLDVAYTRDANLGVICVDASSPLGQTLNQVFLGFLVREFGAQAFSVTSGPGATRTCGAGHKTESRAQPSSLSL